MEFIDQITGIIPRNLHILHDIIDFMDKRYQYPKKILYLIFEELNIKWFNQF